MTASSIEMHDRGGGGCISVEYGAGLHLRDATSTGDTVASDGDGGFLCARFADQIYCKMSISVRRLAEKKAEVVPWLSTPPRSLSIWSK